MSYPSNNNNNYNNINNNNDNNNNNNNNNNNRIMVTTVPQVQHVPREAVVQGSIRMGGPQQPVLDSRYDQCGCHCMPPTMTGASAEVHNLFDDAYRTGIFQITTESILMLITFLIAGLVPLLGLILFLSFWFSITGVSICICCCPTPYGWRMNVILSTIAYCLRALVFVISLGISLGGARYVIRAGAVAYMILIGLTLPVGLRFLQLSRKTLRSMSVVPFDDGSGGGGGGQGMQVVMYNNVGGHQGAGGGGGVVGAGSNGGFTNATVSHGLVPVYAQVVTASGGQYGAAAGGDGVGKASGAPVVWATVVEGGGVVPITDSALIRDLNQGGGGGIGVSSGGGSSSAANIGSDHYNPGGSSSSQGSGGAGDGHRDGSERGRDLPLTRLAGQGADGGMDLGDMERMV